MNIKPGLCSLEGIFCRFLITTIIQRQQLVARLCLPFTHKSLRINDTSQDDNVCGSEKWFLPRAARRILFNEHE